MSAEMVRLPLPEPGDDSHPLDWYPGDDPEERTPEEARAWVEAALTRREDVVKLQGDPGRDSGPAEVSTTRSNLAMPDDATTPPVTAEQAFAAIRRAAQAFVEAAEAIEAAVPHAAKSEQVQLAWYRVMFAQAAPLFRMPTNTPAAYSAHLDTLPYRGQRIYFAQSVDGGPVKIGFTRDIPNRLKQHAYSQKTTMKLLGWMPGDQAKERGIHVQFAAYRVDDNPRTEWFNPAPELLDFIEREARRWDGDRKTVIRSRRGRAILA